jgi:glycosyltransferase involved in cell wall biosynthesis
MHPNKIFIRKTFSGHSAYSGYDLLFRAVEKRIGTQINIWDHEFQRSSLIARLFLGKLNQKISPVTTLFHRPIESSLCELKALVASLGKNIQLFHFGYLENNYALFQSQKIRTVIRHKPVIATIHCPASWWKLYSTPSIARTLDGLIVLSESEINYFHEFIPNNVYYIPHGIDTNFFSPVTISKPSETNDDLRCVFVGQWLRDTETLVKVIEGITKTTTKIVFDIVYPVWKRHNKDFLYRVVNHDNVFFYNRLSDLHLRHYYQQADILLLPLFDCTANNAVLEGMACGLPIITNDVPGIRSYTNDSFATLLKVGDADSMIDALLDANNNRASLKEKGAKAREHAISNFQWGNLAERLLGLYEKYE